MLATGLPVTETTHIDQPSPTAAPLRVTDVIVIEPTEWWLGYHVATAMHLSWPGGIYPLEQPQHAVSRAYLKMSEAIAWSQLPLEAGQTIAEIGCAPGGASQALLDRGLLVLGIDPAEVEPIVQAHPKFVHMRKRGHEVRRREFRKVRWLAADMNVAPQYTLDTVEAIVAHPEVEIRGLLLTLKLLDWSLAAEIPNYLDRIRSWGYRDVKVRQLSHNRQEVCVCAQKS
jgi:23S rRNA (cytidine2498-2'-O)-methyltransferase